MALNAPNIIIIGSISRELLIVLMQYEYVLRAML